MGVEFRRGNISPSINPIPRGKVNVSGVRVGFISLIRVGLSDFEVVDGKSMKSILGGSGRTVCSILSLGTIYNLTHKIVPNFWTVETI